MQENKTTTDLENVDFQQQLNQHFDIKKMISLKDLVARTPGRAGRRQQRKIIREITKLQNGNR